MYMIRFIFVIVFLIVFAVIFYLLLKKIKKKIAPVRRTGDDLTYSIIAPSIESKFMKTRNVERYSDVHSLSSSASTEIICNSEPSHSDESKKQSCKLEK